MRFTIRKAEANDLDILDAILQETAADVNDPNIFVSEDREYIARRLSGAGVAFMALSENEAAGFLLVDFPESGEENLGSDLGWDTLKQRKSAHMDIVCVRPGFRGFGLQKLLIEKSEQALVEMGFDYALATVSPDNPASLNNVHSAGYVIGATLSKYGGVRRHVLWKDLRRRA